MTILNDMGRNRTDKADSEHTVFGKTYLDIYENYFSPIRDKPITFLELGVKNGGSLSTWKQYFPNAKVYGIDIDPVCKTIDNVFICGQDDSVAISKILETIGKPDIIVDDASHINELTLESYKILSPHVNPGGYYIIEDMLCSYDNDLRNSGWQGLQYISPNISKINKRENINSVLVQAIKDLDYGIGLWSDVTIYPMIIMFHRRIK